MNVHRWGKVGRPLLCPCTWVRAQSCLTLCNLMGGSPPGSSLHGIFQARVLEWVSISFSTGSSWSRDRTCVSCVSHIDRQVLYHCATWEDTYMLPLTEELSSCFMLDQQPLEPIDLVLGSSQRNISKQLITNSVTHFFLSLERVISKQISPWMVNVLQMEDISNTSACIYWLSQIVELWS